MVDSKQRKRRKVSETEPLSNNAGESHGINRAPTVHDLPDVILLHIFSFLSTEQLLSTVSGVCDRWHALHSDPSLYRSLTFTRDQPQTSVAVTLLGMARWLKCLRLRERTDTNKILRNVSANSLRLETLVVRQCRGSRKWRSVSADSLRRVLGSCARLRHLSLKGTHCHSRELYEEIGSRLTALTAVDFGKARFFSADALMNVANNCRRIQQLRAFSFTERNTCPHVSDTVVATFCDRFRDSLHTVKISIAFCSDACLTSLSTCVSLTTLNLYNARNVTDLGIAAFCNTSSLAKLTVWDANLVTAEGWIALLNAAVARRMTGLILYYCSNVNDAVCEGLDQSLNEMKVLKLLGSNVTEEGYLGIKMHLPPRCWCVVSNGYGSWYNNNSV